MKNTLLTIWNFYLEGFRSMTLGRTLWVIILLKLFVMFFILKMFFSLISSVTILRMTTREHTWETN